MKWDPCLEGVEREFSRRVELADLDRFAELSGDDNALHLDEDVAKRAGFAGRVAHGMLAGAYFSRLIGTLLPGEGALILACELKFRRPILPPADILVRGRIGHTSESTRSLEIAVVLEQDGKKLVTGTYQVRLL